MRSWRHYYPSKYLEVNDLNGGDLTVTLDRFEEEEMPDFDDPKVKITKPVAYFREKCKPVVFGVYLCKTMETMHGEDMEGWVGKPITFFVEQRPVYGEPKLCLGIRITIAGPHGKPVGAPSTPPPTPDELKELEELRAAKAKKGGKKGRK